MSVWVRCAADLQLLTHVMKHNPDSLARHICCFVHLCMGLCSFVHVSIRRSIHSLIQFIHSCVHTSFAPCIRSSMHQCTPRPIRAGTPSSVHSFIGAFTAHLFMNPSDHCFASIRSCSTSPASSRTIERQLIPFAILSRSCWPTAPASGANFFSPWKRQLSAKIHRKAPPLPTFPRLQDKSLEEAGKRQGSWPSWRPCVGRSTSRRRL